MGVMKECLHCGKEFDSITDEFCSTECVIETSD